MVARTPLKITSCVSLHFLSCRTMFQACESLPYYTTPKVFQVRILNVITRITIKTLFYWITLRHSYRITKWCHYFQQNGAPLPFHTNALAFTDAVVLVMNCKAPEFPHLTRLDLSLCGFIKDVIYVPPIRTALHETAAGHRRGGNEGGPAWSVVNMAIIGISLGHLQGKQGSSRRTAVDNHYEHSHGSHKSKYSIFCLSLSAPLRDSPAHRPWSLMWTQHSHTHTHTHTHTE